jgi:hypothetical protein
MFSTGQFRGLCYETTPGVQVRHVHQHGYCPREYRSHGFVFYVHKYFWLIHSTGWFGGTNIVQPKRTPSTPAAQTGYDANAVMYYHFGDSGYLCGTNGSDDGAAILVQRGNEP